MYRLGIIIWQMLARILFSTASKKDFTHVTFKPDLGKFKMSHLNKDIVSLMTRRAYDIAGCTKGVSVYLNGNKLPVS